MHLYDFFMKERSLNHPFTNDHLLVVRAALDLAGLQAAWIEPIRFVYKLYTARRRMRCKFVGVCYGDCAIGGASFSSVTLLEPHAGQLVGFYLPRGDRLFSPFTLLGMCDSILRGS